MPRVIRTVCAPLGYAVTTGVITGYLVVQPLASLSTWQNLVVAFVAVVTCVKTVTLLNRLPTTKRVVALASAVHKEVRELTCKGVTILRPPDSDTQTVHLRINVRGDAVVVHHVTWNEYYGRTPAQTLIIKLGGQVVPRRNDRTWSEVSRFHQLEYILAALRGGYTQRYEVSKARREGH